MSNFDRQRVSGWRMALAILAAYAMLFMSFAAPAAHAERRIAANTAGSICGNTAGRNAPEPAPLHPDHGDCVCPATCAAAFVLAAVTAFSAPELQLRNAALTKIAAQLPQPRHAAYPGQARAPPRGVQTYSGFASLPCRIMLEFQEFAERLS